MSNARFGKGELLTVIVITLLVTGLSALVLRAYFNRDDRWAPIVSPTNEKPVEIVAVTRLLQPYVRTEKGNFYLCRGNTWRDVCEQVAEERLPAYKIPPRWQTCTPVVPELPPLPGKVVHSLDFARCQEARTYARLVILDDGSIWRWQRTFSWVNGFAFVSGLVVSAALGILASIALVKMRRYLRTPIPQAPMERKAPVRGAK